MNYAQPRQMQTREGRDGGWHYTIRNDDDVWRHQCCRECEHAEDGHETKEEAYECVYQYALKQAEKWESCTFGDWTGCLVCDAPTRTGARWLGAVPGWPEHKPFCDEHLTLEHIQAQVSRPGDATYS